jgi:hypothetical protein
MTIGKLIFGAVLGVALVPVLVTEGRSDTLPGNAGRAFNAADASCFFQPSWNGIGTNCAGTRSWLIPVQNRWGTSTKTFTAYSNFTGLTWVRCEAFIATQGAGLLWKSGLINVGSAGTVLGSAASTANDSLHFVCEFLGGAPGTRELRAVRVTG